MAHNEFEELVRVLKNIISSNINGAMYSNGFALGKITETGLAIDGMSNEIINYMILENLNLNDSYTTEIALAGEYSHSHDFKVPAELKKLQSGDRVLVAQMGADFVVIGRVINA